MIRDESLIIKLSAEEKAKIKEQALKVGLTISAYVRYCALRGGR